MTHQYEVPGGRGMKTCANEFRHPPLICWNNELNGILEYPENNNK
jgi:hypothetical protein